MRKRELCKALAGITMVVSIFGQFPPNTIYAAKTAKKLTVSVKSISLKVGEKKVVKTNTNAAFTVTDKRIVSLKKKTKRQCTVVGKKAGKCVLKIKAGKSTKSINIKITKKKATVQPTVQPQKTPIIEPTQTPTVSTTPAITETPEVSTTPAVTEKTDTEEVTTDVAKVVNAFGYRLWEKQQDKNVVLSPYSIVETLMMLENAADGETKEEILKTMGVSDEIQWNKRMQEFHRENAKQDSVKQLYIANSIWKNDTTYAFDSKVQKEYIENLKNNYGAVEQSMNFNNGNPREQINAWIEKQTNGYIPSLLEDEVKPQDTYSILANTVWFDAKWKNEYFNAFVTRKENFYGKEKTTSVDMMYSPSSEYQNVRYIQKNGIKMVELDFKEDRFVMDVLLSQDEKKTTQECFEALSTEEKNAMFDEISKQEFRWAKIRMPKFESVYNAKHLKEQLNSIGITKLFEKGNAQLPGIQGENKENAYVDTLLHKTVLSVREDGVKAAAASAAIIKSAYEKKEYIDFYVNRPFVYVIRDKKTNMIYFMGSIEQLDATNQIK